MCMLAIACSCRNWIAPRWNLSTLVDEEQPYDDHENQVHKPMAMAESKIIERVSIKVFTSDLNQMIKSYDRN